MKKILTPSSTISDGTKIVKHFQDKSLEKLIEERVGSIKNYIDGLLETKGFDLYNIIISEVERVLISSVLKATNGNKLKASKILGINRNTLSKKIKDLKI